jgi:hypothetical protein
MVMIKNTRQLKIGDTNMKHFVSYSIFSHSQNLCLANILVV